MVARCPGDDLNRKTVVKADIIRAVAKEAKLRPDEAQVVVQHVIDTTIQGMVDDGLVFIPKFGKFNVQNKVARPARVPKTGEPVMVTARKRPSFKSSKFLKQRINS